MKIISWKLKINWVFHSSKQGQGDFFDQNMSYVYKKNVKYR